MPEPGDIAPDFTLPRDGGGDTTLSTLRPQKVVLYFYPKDDTSGCTKQAIAFSDHIDALAEAGAVVVGVSRDSVAKHDKFRDKHGLKVVLLSDEVGQVCESYGVWVEKSMYGKSYMGIERTTFLIDGDGRVERVWHKVKVPGHAEDVLEAVRSTRS
ncbi:thioredoxin-dependent thiol peroxidase [Roseitranquillus sediminis]|uniref:thioredoxin-dependent thiol peroxidase n=1 Tax=Roseitranquillus sediminis TaxID=2809051 RepID=UPI001D0C1D16|nr:thioredoxin-dependent thiol peroxidase [Roseitranquillus sediminis]MBM9595370.1 thioredoxin-dependent thiol peroxidase [Roseitranquillus sediminis]